MYAALVLVGICVLVFVLQKLYPHITELFVLLSSDAFHRPWILVTSVFLHADIGHLLYNALALALFGTILEHIVGKKKFLGIFFVSGLLASIGATFLYHSALGASGAIFGVMGALAMLRPRMQVWVAYFPMPMIVAVVVWTLVDSVRLFLPTGIASLAHLVGLFFGVGVGLYLRKEFGEKKHAAYPLHEDAVRLWEDKWMKK